MRSIGFGKAGLDQRRLAHAPRAPEHDIVTAAASSEMTRIFEHETRLAIDTTQQGQVDSLYLFNAAQACRGTLPEKCVMALQAGRDGRSGSKALEGADNTIEFFEKSSVHGFVPCSVAVLDVRARPIMVRGHSGRLSGASGP